MRIILLVAVVLVLALIVVSVLAYRRRAERALRRSALWVPFVEPRMQGGKVYVGCKLVDINGRVYETMTLYYLDGHETNFEQTLFDAKQDMITNCATLNS